MENRKFKVSGMTCAACSARVERAVSSLRGVDSCQVNLLLGAMSVSGEVSDGEIISAVRAAGYGIQRSNISAVGSDDDGYIEEQRRARRGVTVRLIGSSVLLLLLMYVSMGHNMWSFPLPALFVENPLVLGLIQLILSASILVINRVFFINGAGAILKLAPNMDSLVALGSGASFVYSVCLLFLMADASVKGDSVRAMELLHGLYFEAAAMILVLITVGKLLEAVAKGRTTNAIKELMLLAPKRVTVEREGKEAVIPSSALTVGDIMILRRGESAAADGVVVFGNGSIDEAMLTGEPLPVDKAEGSGIYSGTTLLSGYLKIKAERVGEETALSEILRTVKDAASGKAPVAKVADRVSGFFVPAVMAIAILTAAVWLILGAEIGFALSRGVSVLVVSCPCALGLATPVAIMVGSGVGARHGILFKTASALEMTGRIKTVVLDKTGTITDGKPSVNRIYPLSENEDEVAALASAIEKMSEHPLGAAIVAYANERGLCDRYCAQDFSAQLGGVSAKIGDSRVVCGSLGFVRNMIGEARAKEISATVEELSSKGNTPLILCRENTALGIISISDSIKPESRDAVAALHRMGVRTVMLTGDNEGCASAVAAEIGIDEYIAGAFPRDKAEAVKKFSLESEVLMVGDGINDAPALTSAQVGMAIGAGANIAIDSADAVLVGGRLTGVVDAIRLGRRTLKNIYLNLFWAFCYNIVGIPLAAGVFEGLLGWSLSPMFGALAMSLSSFLVVSSSLSINLFRPMRADSLTESKVNNNIQNTSKSDKTGKGNDKMEKVMILNINGMMCPHCSSRVREALEKIDGVAYADVSHERGDAAIHLDKEVDLEVLVACVENAGYKIVG